MKIVLTSIFVEDQEKALNFYTNTLGFVKRLDIPVGAYRWLALVSPEGIEGVDLILEPNVNPAAKSYQQAIYNQGIPATSFESENVVEEFEKLKSLGVVFPVEPTDTGAVTIAVFDDTCGNLIQLAQNNT